MENPEIMNNEVNNGNEAGQAAENQPGIVSRAIKGVRHLVVRAKATKSGRVVIALTKGAVVGFGLYKTYDIGFKKGQASVQPTIVTITEGVQEEEAPAEETPTEEAPVEAMPVEETV